MHRLHADGPGGFSAACCCWTHVCRRFVKRLENEGSPIAEEMLRRIAALYGVEKAVRGKDPATRLAARRAHSAPIIAPSSPR